MGPKRSEDRKDEVLVSVLFRSTRSAQVLISVAADWEQTGEYTISSTNLRQLEELNPVMQFIANSIADELWERRQVQANLRRKERGGNSL